MFSGLFFIFTFQKIVYYELTGASDGKDENSHEI